MKIMDLIGRGAGLIWNRAHRVVHDRREAFVPVQPATEEGGMSAIEISERAKVRVNLGSGDGPGKKGRIGIEDIASVLGDGSLAELFVETTQAAIEELSEALHRLETDPGDSELILEIRRLAHNIKAASSAAGVNDLHRFVHRTETILNRLEGGEAGVDKGVIALLLKASEVLRVSIEEIRLGTYGGLEGGDMQSFISGESDGGAAGDQPASEFGSRVTAGKGEGDATDGDRRVAKTGGTVRVEAERLEALACLAQELVICKARFARIQSGMNSAKGGEELPLVPDEVAGQWEEVETAFAQATGDLNRISEEIQNGVMKLRTAPIGGLFSRMKSMILGIAAEQGKLVDLDISGEATELDVQWMAGLEGSLNHLVRNSVDHGMESEAERTVVGKPARGTVKLEARQEGQHVVVVVGDDGKGVDVAAVRVAAVERELVSEARAEGMTDQEIVPYVFHPGLSTAAEVTELSGRGMGMDIVRHLIEGLGGTVAVDTSAGEGTRVTIKIPYSRRKTPSLLVTIGEGVFAIPAEGVQGTPVVRSEDMLAIRDNLSFKWEDQVVPVAFIGEAFDGSKIGPAGSRKLDTEGCLVIVQKGQQMIGLMVDALIGREDVVIKSRKKDSRHVRGGEVSASVSGDGRISLNLDVGTMLVPIGRIHADDDLGAVE